jgi:hypothetical protein
MPKQKESDRGNRVRLFWICDPDEENWSRRSIPFYREAVGFVGDAPHT